VVLGATRKLAQVMAARSSSGRSPPIGPIWDASPILLHEMWYQ